MATRVRERGLMVSLTDLWLAAGSPGHRMPTAWLALPDTAEFRAFLRSRWPQATSPFRHAGDGSSRSKLRWIPAPGTWTPDPDGLVASSPNDSATWAHWQLALSHAAAITANLRGKARRVRVLELPDLPPKGDVSDWLARGGTAAQLEGLVRQAQQPENKDALPLLWLDDIAPVLEAKDFVQGVLVEGGAAIVYGGSNTGKTFWITDLALHVAAGKPWNGRRVDRGGVVYCALEGGNGFRNRVVAWREAHVGSAAKLPFAAIPASLDLLDPAADTPRLIDAVRRAAEQMGCPVKLVVVDTLSRAMAGGNENAPDDMGALVRSMDEIRQQTGACVLFAHHSGKDTEKGARGHSLLRAAVDTEIEVRADEAAGARTATVVKQRELAKDAVFGFRLDTVILGQNQHGEDVTTCIVIENGADPICSPKRERLHEEAESLQGHITDLFARGHGREDRPTPDMPPVLMLPRKILHTHLIQRGWLQLSAQGAVDIDTWLHSLGLPQYAQAFCDNDISEDLLQTLTEADLREIGVVSLGHRRRLLAAIAALAGTADVQSGAADLDALELPPEPEAERRQVNVLFCDLEGSTAISSQLDPEDLRRLTTAYHRCAADVIERWAGRVANYMGDGVMACFGHLRAREDDPERAVAAGLDLVEAVSALAMPAGRTLRARIGIATGLVVVGRSGGGPGAAREREVIGETPNRAARLQALATPGTVVADAATRRCVGELFECQGLDPVQVKGLPRPVQVCQVLRRRTAVSRSGALHAVAASALPMLGRDAELGLLRGWAQAKDGEGRVVLLSGESGIGKSRLAAALAEGIADEPHACLRHFCSPQHRDSPLFPIINHLEHTAGFDRDDVPEAKLGKLTALLARDEITLVAELMGLPVSGGVPLFVEELTRAAIEADWHDVMLAEAVGPATQLPTCAVPAALYAPLAARLDRLGGPAREVAQIGAVVGQEFTHELLAAVAQRSNEELQGALERLVEAGLIVRMGGGEPSQAAVYVFKHALVRDAAYGTLLRARRRELHAAVADAMANPFPETTVARPELLAYHYEQAGMVELAVDCWSEAGRQAMAASAMAEAATHLRRALELLSTLPATPVHRRRELDVAGDLGSALIASKGYTDQETGRTLDRALVIVEQLDDVPQLVRAMRGKYNYHLMRGEAEAAARYADTLLRGASGQSLATAHQLLEVSLIFKGEFGLARKHLENATTLLGCAGDDAAHMPGGWEALIAVPAYLSAALAISGCHSRARLQNALCIARARKEARPHRFAFALYMASALHLLLREDAPGPANALSHVATENRFPYWIGAALTLRGLALARAGETEDGLSLLEEGIARHDDLGAVTSTIPVLSYFAEVIGCDRGLNLVEGAFTRNRSTELRWFDPELYRIRSKLRYENGDVVTAEADGVEALKLASRQGARCWELRVAGNLARLWCEQGRRDEALDLLTPVYDGFPDKSETLDLVDTRALLDRFVRRDLSAGGGI